MFYGRLEQDDLLLYYLFCYIAELFPILWHCWGILYLITLLRCFISWNLADVYPDLLHCWAVPNLKILLMFSVCYYIAELYPIIVYCRTMVYLKTLLLVFAQRCRQPIRIEYYVTQKPRHLLTTVQVPMFYGRLEQDDLLLYYLCCYIAELFHIL